MNIVFPHDDLPKSWRDNSQIMEGIRRLHDERDVPPKKFWSYFRNLDYGLPYIGCSFHTVQLCEGYPIRLKGTLEAISPYEWKIISLKRRNRLDQFASWENALIEQVWWNQKTENQVRFTVDGFQRFCADQEKFDKRIWKQLHGLPRICVWYESLCLEQESTSNRILDFLELPRTKLHTSHVKQDKRETQDKFTNWNEVQEALSKGLITKFTPFPVF